MGSVNAIYYSAFRIEHGYPEPFVINYVEIGNEDFFGMYPRRFEYIYPVSKHSTRTSLLYPPYSTKTSTIVSISLDALCTIYTITANPPSSSLIDATSSTIDKDRPIIPTSRSLLPNTVARKSTSVQES